MIIDRQISCVSQLLVRGFNFSYLYSVNKRRTYYTLVFILIAAGFSIAGWSQPNEKERTTGNEVVDAYQLIKDMFTQCSQVNTMACEVKKRERYGGEYIDAHSRIKMSTDPYRVYLMQLAPSEGVEVLYRDSENSGKVLVNPNGFPWININLDPYGSLMRKNQHHVIHDIGFSKFNSVLEHLLKKYGDKGDDFVRYFGKSKISKRDCHVIDIQIDDYSLVPYKTGDNESTMSISNKFKISEYRIVELNENVSGYGNLKPEMLLTIPSDYAPKIRLFIDSERHIPMRFEVYDDAGELFEAYEYDHVKLNITFTQDELTPDFSEYGF